MAFSETGSVQLQLPVSAPNILKSSTSLEEGLDATGMGMGISLLRKFSKDKNHTLVAVEAPCEISYTIEPSLNDRYTDQGNDFALVEDVVMQEGEPVQAAEDRLPSSTSTHLLNLPEEVQQNILGFLVGDLGSISSKSSGTGVRNWHYALRHSRAKDLTNLALVTPLWTRLIQQRLYRHIRIQGTRQGLEECFEWFQRYPHLKEHVRHVDFWVPVWEKRSQPSIPIQPIMVTDDLQQAESMQPITNNYRLSSKSSTLQEMFMLVGIVFQKACVLTIEGGTCKKPPRIPISRDDEDSLPILPNIRTLVLKSAWTIIRDSSDYERLNHALPNVGDWQCMFAAPKYRAYTTMNKLIPRISPQIRHLHLCMDGFFSKKWLSPAKVEDLRINHHLCASIGTLLSQLEAFTFSGRACYCLFNHAIEACYRNPGYKPRLKSLDLALRNCCRDSQNQFGDGLGMYNLGFISAFEKLVAAATGCLKVYTNLASVRIRFVDLDSPMASLNPYFQIKDHVAYGIYSETIMCNLISLTRPIVFAYDPNPTEEEHRFGFHTRRTAGRRPNRIHVSEYASFGLGHGR